MRQAAPVYRILLAATCVCAVCFQAGLSTGQDTSPAAVPPAATDTIPFEIIRRSPHGLPVAPIRVAGERFEMEIAATDAHRRRGCGGRSRLPLGTGMIFVHPDEQVRRFWMKDCLIDLDIAFLDGNGRIVALHRMKKEPPRRTGERTSTYEERLKRYPSRRPARYALEFEAGTLDRLKLKVGQVIALPHAELRGLTRGPA